MEHYQYPPSPDLDITDIPSVILAIFILLVVFLAFVLLLIVVVLLISGE